MILFIKSYGFYTILFFASWPNMLFDVCCIACGYCLISFKVFIKATMIGKALIKSPLQALLLIYMIIQALNNESLSFLPDFINNYIKSLTESEKRKTQNQSYFRIDNDSNISNIINIDNLKNNNNEGNYINFNLLVYYIWNGLIISIFLYFIKSLIEAAANEQFDKYKKGKKEKKKIN